MSQNTNTNTNVLSDEEMHNILVKIFTYIIERNEPLALRAIRDNSIYRNPRGNSIFNMVNANGNNILIEACRYKLTNVAVYVIRRFNDLFNLGLANNNAITALISCIYNNMYEPIFELLEHPESLPELRININRFTALDMMLRKNITNYDVNDKRIVVEIINLYLQYNPNSQNFHRCLNKICADENLKQVLQPRFNPARLDFNKICAPVEPTTAELRSNLATTHNISYNTRNVAQNIQEAQQRDNIQIAERVVDPYMNFDANEYTPDEMNNLRLPKRIGGKKYRTKRRQMRHKKANLKKTKTKGRGKHNTKRRHYKRKRSFLHK